MTSVRDVGGPSFALKRAIDEGIVAGPRIFPAGGMISQTSGHGDFRMRHEVPRGSTTPLSNTRVNPRPSGRGFTKIFADAARASRPARS